MNIRNCNNKLSLLGISISWNQDLGYYILIMKVKIANLLIL